MNEVLQARRFLGVLSSLLAARRRSQVDAKPPLAGRIVAWLLLAITVGFYAAPLAMAAVSDSDSGLPACCRRHGKHHCVMMDRYLGTSSGNQILEKPQRCPFYPEPISGTSGRMASAISTSSSSEFPVAVESLILREENLSHRIEMDSGLPKRGPPA